MKHMKLLFLAFVATLLLTMSKAAGEERPNILWLTSEDNSVDWMSCYGNAYAETPNLDRLAGEGFQYSHCYANAPVCATQRSTWIAGVLSLSTGTCSNVSENRTVKAQKDTP